MQLPPDPIPPLNDHGLDEPGPYAYSGLRELTGTRINPLCQDVYQAKRSQITDPSYADCTAVHPDLPVMIGEIQGFDPRMRTEQPPVEQWPLSRIIPRVPVSANFPSYPLEPGTYAIDYESLSTSRSALPDKDWIRNLRDKFPEGSHLMLTFIGRHHDLLHLMWDPAAGFWQHEILDQFDSIITPEFSTFINDPRPQYMYGERQKQIFTDEGWQAGVNIIPAIAFSGEQSLRRQADLIGSFVEVGKVNTVLLDLLGAGFKTGHDRLAWVFSRLELLRKYVAHWPVRFIISNGASIPPWLVAELWDMLPHGNFHVLTSGPFTQDRMRANLSGEERSVLLYREIAQIKQRVEENPSAGARREAPTIPDRMWGDPV